MAEKKFRKKPGHKKDRKEITKPVKNARLRAHDEVVLLRALNPLQIVQKLIARAVSCVGGEAAHDFSGDTLGFRVCS
jgi:hypothetical protein